VQSALGILINQKYLLLSKKEAKPSGSPGWLGKSAIDYKAVLRFRP